MQHHVGRELADHRLVSRKGSRKNFNSS